MPPALSSTFCEDPVLNLWEKLAALRAKGSFYTEWAVGDASRPDDIRVLQIEKLKGESPSEGGTHRQPTIQAKFNKIVLMPNAWMGELPEWLYKFNRSSSGYLLLVGQAATTTATTARGLADRINFSQFSEAAGIVEMTGLDMGWEHSDEEKAGEHLRNLCGKTGIIHFGLNWDRFPHRELGVDLDKYRPRGRPQVSLDSDQVRDSLTRKVLEPQVFEVSGRVVKDVKSGSGVIVFD